MTVPAACPAFVVSAENYDRLMGRYLPALAPAFADAAGIRGRARLLDVGAGPGGLTRELAQRAGAENITAIDPSPPFVAACRERNPGVQVHQGVAEELPFPDAMFDATLASLVVGFMNDPIRGLREMARVTRPAGTVAVCFWDLDRMPALGIFWTAAARLDPEVTSELRRPGGAPGELATLLRQAGLHDVHEGVLQAQADYADFDDWWNPNTLGVGPIGTYYNTRTPTERTAIRDECRRLLGSPAGRFTLHASCWFAAGKHDLRNKADFRSVS